jgi:hypothetical protein
MIRCDVMPRAVATIALIIAFSAVAGVAHASYAEWHNYWGYNNLSRTNPPAGTCSGQGAAVACSGFNYTPPHDFSAIDMPSGNAVIAHGYQNCSGCTIWKADWPAPGYDETSWDYYAGVLGYPVSGYNRVVCLHTTNNNTYAYTQCRWGKDLT